MSSIEPYAIIMSGGRGKRFWPLSQLPLPKQFLHFAGEGTLFQQTYRRLRRLMPAEHVFTVTRQSYKPLVLEQVKEFLPENVIVEPVQLDTGPCVALGTAYIQHRAPDAAIAALPADHYIADESRFVAALDVGLNYAVSAREVVTFGIPPEYPHPGFGYIQVGNVITRSHGFQIHRAQHFIEKPNLETAQRLIASNTYCWNSGIFCWRADVIFDAFRQTVPGIYERMKSIQAHIGTDTEAEALVRAYEQMPTISIDHGVMEQISQLAVVPIEVGWNDVGSWAALRRLYPVSDKENLVLGKHSTDQVTGSTILGAGRIVVIGVNNVIVALNGSDVLVCARDQEGLIQKIVDQLEQET
jgi:mannose-1-phosphate guanylyltransferase